MGVFGAIKGALKGVGKVARKAAPALAFIPGVGTLAAAGIGAAGGLLGGEGFKGMLKGAAGGALGGLASGRIPGVGNLLKSGGGGLIRGVGDYLKDNPSVVLGGISALGNAQDASRQRGFEDEEAGFARESMQRRRALEDDIMSGFGQAPPSFDFSNVYADPSNPFYQPPPPGVPGVGGPGVGVPGPEPFREALPEPIPGFALGGSPLKRMTARFKAGAVPKPLGLRGIGRIFRDSTRPTQDPGLSDVGGGSVRGIGSLLKPDEFDPRREYALV